jgi:hypothetical protein
MTPVSPVLKRSDAPEIVFAKDQPQYIPLPAVRSEDGLITTRWKLTWRERLTLFLRGDLYLQVLTFNRPLQPLKLSVTEPDA